MTADPSSTDSSSHATRAAWAAFRVTKAETRKGTVLAFLAWTLAVFDFILFGTMLPEIQASFGWSDEHAAAVVTAIAIGTAITVFLMGPITDRLGRRKGMMATVAATACASAATAATTNTASLVAVRSIGGVGSGEQAVNTTYLNELYALSDDKAITSRRGLIYGIVQSGWPLGALLAAGFAALLTPFFDWRMIFLLATLPALVVLFMRRNLKETPQFQMEKKLRDLERSGDHEAATNLARRFGLRTDAKGSLRDVFSPENRKNTSLVALAYCFSWFGVQTFSVLGTTVLTRGLNVEVSSALIIVVASNLVAAGGYVFHGWAGDKLGRRRVVVVGWFVSACLFAGMLLLPLDALAIVIFYGFGLFFLIGPYSALVFYMGEIFDARARATGAALVTAAGQPGAVIASSLITALLASGVEWTNTALYVGVGGIFLSAVVLSGAHSPTKTEAGMPHDFPA